MKLGDFLGSDDMFKIGFLILSPSDNPYIQYLKMDIKNSEFRV